MKTTWLVINQSDAVMGKPYSHQYLVFEKGEDMIAYLEKAGWSRDATPALASLVTDIGYVNFYANALGVDLKAMRLEVK